MNSKKLIQRRLMIIAAAVLVLAAIVVSPLMSGTSAAFVKNEAKAEAQSSVWDGIACSELLHSRSEYNPKTTGAAGTKTNPYLIQSAADLAYLASHADSMSGTELYSGVYFEQTVDIDLNNKDWRPICGNLNSSTAATTKSFCGVYDGAGFEITNLSININTIGSAKRTYGLFASIGWSSTASASKYEDAGVKNLAINGADISLSANVSKDTAIGCVTGIMCTGSKVENCIVKNAQVYSTGAVTLTSTVLLAAGGISGDAALSVTGTAVVDSKYVFEINNCFSDVDINFGTVTCPSESGSTYYQYNLGGIIGRIRSHANFPVNCIYTGTITAAKAFIGPIFGVDRYAPVGNAYSVFTKMFAGLNDSGASLADATNCYFYDYTVNNAKFNSQSTAVDSENSPVTIYDNSECNGAFHTYTLGNSVSTNGSDMSRLQGVNRGTYADISSDSRMLLSMLNTYATNNGELTLWSYHDTTGLGFAGKKIVANYEFDGSKWNIGLSFKEYTENELNNLKYIYTVTNVRTGETDETKTVKSVKVDNIIIIPASSDEKVINISVYDGATLEKTINHSLEALTYKLTWGSSIVSDETMLNVYVKLDDRLDNTGTNLITWYKDGNIVGTGNSLSMKNYSFGDVFTVKSIYNNNSNIQAEITVTYGSTYVYVCRNGVTLTDGTSYAAGSDSNDGATPDNAVYSLQRAYELLDPLGNEKSNVIVIMGNYDSNQYSKSSADQITFGKPATLTTYVSKANTYVDKYENATEGVDYIDYKGVLTMYSNSSEGTKLLFADTRMQYLTLSAAKAVDDTQTSSKELYIYCQGNDLYMGYGMKMKDYSVAKASDTTGIEQGKKYIGIHIVGGYFDYNHASTDADKYIDPDDSCDITLLSGLYGRVIGSGRNTKISSASNNIFGSSECYFRNHIVIDINNSGWNYGSDYVDFDIGLVCGGQTDGSTFTNSEIVMNKGSVGTILGGSIGYGRLVTASNGKQIYSNDYIGSAKITMNGGTVKTLYGGSLGRVALSSGNLSAWNEHVNTRFFGSIEINMQGGTITNTLYACGAGGVTYYSEDLYDLYDEVMITEQPLQDASEFGVIVNMSGGEILGSLYGGGHGYSQYMTAEQINAYAGSLLGNTEVIVSGGVVDGNVYGGSNGTNLYSGNAKQYFGTVCGNTKVVIDGTADIKDSVYGGSEGYIIADTTGKDIKIATVINDTNLFIKGGKIADNAVGGGKVANVDGNTNIDITGGVIRYNNTDFKEKGCVFGGCFDNGTVGKGTTINIHGTGVKLNTIREEIFGAGFGSTTTVDGDTHINIYEDAVLQTTEITLRIFGGGLDGSVKGNTYIEATDNNSELKAMLYGGGRNADIEGNTSVMVNGYSVDGGVFGGGYDGAVRGNTTVEINDANEIIGTVFGGGYNGHIYGNTDVTISGSQIVGVLVDHFDENGNADKSKTDSICVAGGGYVGSVYGDTNVTINDNAFMGKIFYFDENNEECPAEVSTTYRHLGAALGGGVYGNVYGTTDVFIDKCVCYGEVFGGSFEGSVYNHYEEDNLGKYVATADSKPYSATVEFTDGMTKTLYGGGYYGTVYGNVHTTVGTGATYAAINRSMYGGGAYSSITGDAVTDIYSAYVGYELNYTKENGFTVDIANPSRYVRYKDQNGTMYFEDGNVFCGGFGDGADVEGNTVLNIHPGKAVYILNSIYGGGEAGNSNTAHTYTNQKKTTISINENGTDYIKIGGNIYGGGRGYLYDDDNNIQTRVGGRTLGETVGDVTLTVEKAIVGNNQTYLLDGQEVFLNGGSIFGGGETGVCDGAVTVTATDVKIDGDISGGGYGETSNVYGIIEVNVNCTNAGNLEIDGSVSGDGYLSKVASKHRIINLNGLKGNRSISAAKGSGVIADDLFILRSIQYADEVNLNDSHFELLGHNDRIVENDLNDYSVIRVNKLNFNNGSLAYFDKEVKCVEEINSMVDNNGGYINNPQKHSALYYGDVTAADGAYGYNENNLKSYLRGNYTIDNSTYYTADKYNTIVLAQGVKLEVKTNDYANGENYETAKWGRVNGLFTLAFSNASINESGVDSGGAYVYANKDSTGTFLTLTRNDGTYGIVSGLQRKTVSPDGNHTFLSVTDKEISEDSSNTYHLWYDYKESTSFDITVNLSKYFGSDYSILSTNALLPNELKANGNYKVSSIDLTGLSEDVKESVLVTNGSNSSKLSELFENQILESSNSDDIFLKFALNPETLEAVAQDSTGNLVVKLVTDDSTYYTYNIKINVLVSVVDYTVTFHNRSFNDKENTDFAVFEHIGYGLSSGLPQETPDIDGLTFTKWTYANGTTYDGTAKIYKNTDVYPVFESEPPSGKFAFYTEFSYNEPWSLSFNSIFQYNYNGQSEMYGADDFANSDDYGLVIYRTDSDSYDATQKNLIKDGTFCKASVSTEIVNGYTMMHFDYSNLNKPIYTYQLDDHIYVMFYVKVDGVVLYSSISDRQMSEIVKGVANGTIVPANVSTTVKTKAKALCNSIYDMFTATKKLNTVGYEEHMAGTSVNNSVLSNYTSANIDKATEIFSSQSGSVRFIEPWGLKLSCDIESGYAGYGVVVYNCVNGDLSQDGYGRIKFPSLNYLLGLDSAKVYYYNADTKQGNATYSDGKFTAYYVDGVYTNCLDSDVLIAYFAIDRNGNIIADETTYLNIYDTAKENAELMSGYGEYTDNVTLLNAMTNMYDKLKDYCKTANK